MTIVQQVGCDEARPEVREADVQSPGIGQLL